MNYAIMEIFIDTRILSIWNNQIDKIGSLIADYTKYDAYHSKYCINKPSQHSIKKIECCEYNKNKGGVFLTSNAILSLYFFLLFMCFILIWIQSASFRLRDMKNWKQNEFTVYMWSDIIQPKNMWNLH